MSKKANNLAELEKRKAQLEAEITTLKSDLSLTVDGIKEEIEEKSKPLYWIDRYPLQILAVTVATGFGFGLGLGGKKSKKESPSNESGSISATVGEEIKKMLMKKGTEMLIKIITEKLESYKAEKDS